MARGGKVSVDITGSARGLTRATRDAEGALDRLNRAGSRAFGALKVGALAAGAAAGTGLALTLKVGTEELLEQSKATAQTEAVLKSTGGVANVTKKEIEGLAQALQDQSGIADDAIQSSANLLLSFTKIRNEAGQGNDIFNQATQAALDLSVAFDKDLGSTSIALGKALNDPIKGVTALGKAGVQFTEQQRDQIKTLVESGDTLKAQKLILAELNTQVEGSAKAFGESDAGQIERAKRAYEDFSESVAVTLAPALRVAATFLRDVLLPAMTELADHVSRFLAPVFERLAPIVEESLGRIVRFYRDHFARIFEGVSSGIGDLSTAGDGLRAFAERILPVLGQAFSEASRIIADVAGDIVATIRRLAPVVAPLLEALADVVLAAVRLIGAVWDKWGDEILLIVRTVFTNVARVLRPLLRAVQAVIETITAAIEGDWSGVWEGLKDIVRNVLAAVVALLRGALSNWKTIATLLGKAIWEGVKLGLRALGELGKYLLGLARDGIVGAASRALDLAKSIGQNIKNGIINGLEGLAGQIRDKLLDAISGGTSGLPFNPFDLGGAAAEAVTGRARGGYIGGPRGAGDVVPVMAKPGEAFLTEQQQRIIGPQRIYDAFRRTGGVIGGRRFETGGMVGRFQDALDFAQAQVGEPYGKPSRGESRTGPDSWDCSGYATTVASKAGASVTVGGTTVTAWNESKGVGEPYAGIPVLFGFRSNNGAIDGGYDEHMGIRVLGQWFDAGGSHGGVGSGDSSWTWFRVPNGLPMESDGALADGQGEGDPDDRKGVLARRKEAREAKAEAIREARAPLIEPLGGKGIDTLEEVNNRFAPSDRRASLKDKKREKSARAAAAAAGITNPEKVDLIARNEVDKGQKARLMRRLTAVRNAAKKAKTRRANLAKTRAALFKQLRKTPARNTGRVESLRNRISTIRDQLTATIVEIKGLITEAADLQGQARELGFDIGEATAEIAALPDVDESDAGEVDAGPTEEDFLNAAIAQAGLTADLGDDLAAAQAAETYYGHLYNAAVASGDPRQIAAAAEALGAARSRVTSLLEQMKGNEEAKESALRARAEQQASAERAGRALSDAALRSITGSGDLFRSDRPVVVVNVDGSLIHQDNLAAVIAQAASGQSAVAPPVIPSGT